MATVQRINLSSIPKVKSKKYHNVVVEVDGHRFDSKKECNRYGELTILQKAGIIRDLKLQVPFELVPAQPGGLRSERAVTYYADFQYYDIEKQKMVLEDAKGVITKDYRIKRALMKQMGHEIVEV